METTEVEHLATPPAVTLNSKSQYYLKQSGKWSSFLGIFGFIICTIILLMTLLMPTKSFMKNEYSDEIPAFVGWIIRIAYILLDTVYFFLSLYLYKFGNGIKDSAAFKHEQSVENALGNLRAYFKLGGIFIIVTVALCMLLLFLPFILTRLMN